MGFLVFVLAFWSDRRLLCRIRITAADQPCPWPGRRSGIAGSRDGFGWSARVATSSQPSYCCPI